MAFDFPKIKIEYDTLQTAVKQAEKTKQPIEKYVKRQIQLVEEICDEYVKQSDAHGIDKKDLQRNEALISYNAQLQGLAEKIGISAEKYINKIKEFSANFPSFD